MPNVKQKQRPGGCVTVPVEHSSTSDAMKAVTTALALCCVYLGVAAARYLAVKTAQLLADSVALVVSNPLQAGALLVLTVGIAGARGDRQRHAAQAASTVYLRIVTTFLTQPAQGKKRQAAPQPSQRAAAPTKPAVAPPATPPRSASGESPALPDSPIHSAGSSDGECSFPNAARDVTSFRIPDNKLRPGAARPRHVRRHLPRSVSMDPPSSRDRVELRPKPRMSIDFDSTVTESPTKASSQRSRSHPRPADAEPWRRQRRRSSAGDSAASSSRSRSSTPTGTTSSKLGGRVLARGRQARWQPSMHRVASGQELAMLGANSAAREMEKASHPAPSTAPGVLAASTPASEGSGWPAAGSMASVGSWVSTASVSLASLTTRVDSLLRPLVPAAPSLSPPALQLPWRLPWPAPAEAHEESPLPSGRRSSMDGGSSRHYTHGGIAATPGRQQALERYAVAARLQGKAGACSAAAGDSALASLGLDGDCPQAIRDIVSDEHLLQFAAAMDEPACCAALQDLGIPSAWSAPAVDSPRAQHSAALSSDSTAAHNTPAAAPALFGAQDADAAPAAAGGWQQVVDEDRPGLRLRAWRLPLRNGLYMYRSTAVLEGVCPRDVRPFHLDDQARRLWDDGVVEVRRVGVPGSTPGSRPSRHAESCLHTYTSRFPRPLAQREYNYARRVWHRPSDGGCYAIARHCDLPEGPSSSRSVKVLEFISSTVVRAAPGSGGASTEVASIYFENSQVRPGLAKMAVPKGLWSFWNKYDDALRLFVQARRAAACSGGGPAAAGGATARRRSVDGERAAAGEAVGGEESDGGSEDDVYDALVEMQLHRGVRAALRAGLAASPLWPRRVMIAGALRMLQVMLAAS